MFKTGAWPFNLFAEKPELNRDCVDILESNIWRDDLRQAYEDINNGIYSSNHTSGTKKPEIKIRRLLECEPRDWFFSQSEDPKKVVMRESIFELFRMCTFDLDGSLRHDFLRPSTWLPSPWLPSTELRIANET